MENEHIVTISFQDPNLHSKGSEGNRGNYGSDLLLDTGLEKWPVEVHCSNCNASIKTLVEKKLRKGSCIFPIICFFVGNFFLIFVAMCMDAFREWRHYCPKCKAFVGRFVPTTSGNALAAIMMVTLCISALEVCIIFTYFQYWNDIRHHFGIWNKNIVLTWENEVLCSSKRMLFRVSKISIRTKKSPE